MLTNADLTRLTALRRRLHAHPEVSGAEAWTAGTVAEALRALGVEAGYHGADLSDLAQIEDFVAETERRFG
ncbi:MAG: hypothetical protein ACK414_15610, partial [Gemmobacter sp.]